MRLSNLNHVLATAWEGNSLSEAGIQVFHFHTEDFGHNYDWFTSLCRSFRSRTRRLLP
jgi:hypothetical protein